MPETLRVPKMKCEGCVAAIKDALSRIEGIGEYSVNLDNKTVVVDPGEAGASQVKKALSDAGYPPES